MKLERLATCFALALITSVASVASAEADTTFTYQGELAENGSPANGAFNLDISLWDALTGGTQIGSTIMLDGVPVAGGKFTVELDFGAAAFDNLDRWIDFEVNGVTLTPRQPIARAPYAIQTRGIFADDNYNIGIGTTTPTSELEVANPTAGDGAAIGIIADDTGGALAAYSSTFTFPHLAGRVSLFGSAFDSTGLDLRADSVTGDIRFYTGGFAESNESMRITNTGDIGIGTSSPEEQLHVFGQSPALKLEDNDLPGSFSILKDSAQSQAQLQKRNASGNVVFDIDPLPVDGFSDASLRLFRSTDTTGLKRVLFYRGNNSTATSAAIGMDGADSYFQLHGGDLGIGTATPNAKLHVVTDSDPNPAIYGETTGAFSKPAGRFVNQSLGYGVDAKTFDANGRGIYGYHASGSGSGSGVYGRTDSPNGYGVISEGDFGASGTKSFIQPHPYDATKQVRFFCLEGNEAGTYFRGTARLENGSAYIEVPEEFRLVTDPAGLTVQLTPRGPDAGLWVRSSDLELIHVMGRGDVEFDYLVNGIRRGYTESDSIESNHFYVPTTRGKPFGTQYPDEIRKILVDNGILNEDFTPNEQTAAAMGWTLRGPDEQGTLARDELRQSNSYVEKLDCPH